MLDTYHEPLPKLSLQKIVDMSGVLFNSLYNSELPNTKGCAQWKIELQLFGKGGLVIVLVLVKMDNDHDKRVQMNPVSPADD